MTDYGTEAKREPIDEAELERMSREFIRSSLGGLDSEIGAVRERNIRAYNGAAEGDFAPPDILDRSTFVSTDVADTVDGMLPQIIDVFVSDEKAVEAKPKKGGPEALAVARTVTGYLNHLFYDQNEGLNILYDWFQDAGLQKVGFAKAWAEEEKEDARQEYEQQTPDQLAMLLQDGVELEAEPEIDENGLLSFTVIDRSQSVKIRADCIPSNEMRVGPTSKWGADPIAIGEVRQKPRFELEEMGYDLENVGGEGVTLNAESDALLGDGFGEAENELHDSHKLYEYAELYFKLDVDGDGVAEWVQLCLINGTLMTHEKVDDHPYAFFSFMPLAHAFYGNCPADRAYGIQKENTNLGRLMLDNLAFAVNGRNYVNTNANVNIDDLLDNRPGGLVRGQGENGVTPIPTQQIPQSAWQMQEWLNVKLENRTGFTRYSQGMDADSLNKTATGVQIITGKSEMRLKLMTRFAALGVKTLFRKMLKLAVAHQSAEQWFEVNGEYVAVRPNEWRDQFNIKINVGLGHGTRQEKMQAVGAMIPLQQMGMQVGVVRPEHIANTIRLGAEVNEFKNPEQFCDEQAQGLPNPEQFAQMQQQMQELQQENVQLKGDSQLKQAELGLKHREIDLKEQELGLKAVQGEQELALKSRDAERADHETSVKSAETQHKMQQTDDEGERIAALEQQMAQVVGLLQQLAPPQGQDGAQGMDAPQEPMA
ncbi:portal protein [Noviluteimonas gilva]|uniref:Portal protein n=1 Tax=Noviluteimonas gilva TaxID=2682097 RepID=A0A7C9M2S9_9GAMM|nr:hypothetical protein [Lysobacter gilvus]MUV13582.1 hypothetical protein [Lysobacter gilvus]